MSDYKGFRDEELEKVFKAVCDASDWKLPIHAEIDPAYRRVVEVAIEYYAGGGADFTDNGKTIEVTAPGYYQIIGS